MGLLTLQSTGDDLTTLMWIQRWFNDFTVDSTLVERLHGQFALGK